jgi:hypothetical protein
MFVLSVAAVSMVLAGCGFIISMMASYLQCSKTGVGTSIIQSLYFSTLPTLAYAVSSFFVSIRLPFSNTLQSYGMPVDSAAWVGVGYLVMLASWITSVQVINATEKAVCQPSVNEMADFKKKLLSELQEKEKSKEYTTPK